MGKCCYVRSKTLQTSQLRLHSAGTTRRERDMHVREDLWLPEREFIEGRVCLELFDARTGKLQERVKHHNYVADTLVAAIKAQARGLLTGALNHATSPNQDWPFMYGGTNGGGPCFGFWLTDA